MFLLLVFQVAGSCSSDDELCFVLREVAEFPPRLSCQDCKSVTLQDSTDISPSASHGLVL